MLESRLVHLGALLYEEYFFICRAPCTLGEPNFNLSFGSPDVFLRESQRWIPQCCGPDSARGNEKGHHAHVVGNMCSSFQDACQTTVFHACKCAHVLTCMR